jgi:hypothetical protein
VGIPRILAKLIETHRLLGKSVDDLLDLSVTTDIRALTIMRLIRSFSPLSTAPTPHRLFDGRN